MNTKQQGGLTDLERNQMRGSLRAFMAVHPAEAPLSTRFRDWGNAALAMPARILLLPHGRFAVLAAVFLISTGMGTSYAAQGALPGDALYAVKININEKVAGALTVGTTERGRFDATLAARRLEEAEVLAAQSKLSPELSSEIQGRISTLAAAFNENVTTLAASEDGATAAVELQSDLEATLSAHAHVIATLQDTVPQSESTLSPILAMVSEKVSAARKARAKSERALTAQKSEPVKVAATAQGQSAREAAGEVEARAATLQGGHATTSETLAKRALKVQQTVARGDEHLNRGDYGKALGVFQAALRAATEAQTETDVTIELQKILPTLPLDTATTSAEETDVEDEDEGESSLDAPTTIDALQHDR